MVLTVKTRPRTFTFKTDNENRLLWMASEGNCVLTFAPEIKTAQIVIPSCCKGGLKQSC